MSDSNSCRLCLDAAAASLATNNVIKCFDTSVLAAAGEDSKKCTVAEILMKHFWFELRADRDADAFVCLSCWHKVDAFHQFYQSVLVRYQNRWQQASQINPAVNGTNSTSHKWECAMAEPTENEDETNSYEDSIKTEEVDTSEERLATTTQRKRGRPRKSADVGAFAIKLESNADEAPLPDDSTVEHAELSKYFSLQCDICATAVPNLPAARMHYQHAHKQRGFLQCHCGQRFSRTASIREHCAFHADPSAHKCLECNKIFTSSERLTAHRQRKHDDNDEPKAPAAHSKTLQHQNDELLRQFMSMFCDLCSAAFSTFEEAVQHHEDAHDVAGYLMCCGKKFRKKCRAVLHCRWHANPQQFDCPQCGRNFSGIACLRRHIGDKHPSSDSTSSFQCDECTRSFHLQTQLHIHKRLKHTPVELLRFECYRCHKRFLYLSHLRNHLRDTHDNTGPSHVCDVCAKAFHSKWNYELHYALEHGTESLQRQCPECGKWLKHAECLKRHIKSNHGERRPMPPVACDQCPHVASNRRALYVHRKLKHREPAFQCLVCEKRFKMKIGLREHMAIHAGIKDLYKCAYCPMTFRSNANKYKHRRLKHAAQLEMDRKAASVATANELQLLDEERRRGAPSPRRVVNEGSGEMAAGGIS